ncbi:MAG: O-antigen ligase family protein [Pseudomonadota bacterium]
MAYAIQADTGAPAALSALAKLSLAIAVFLSAFVLYEPAPYEVYIAVLMTVWFLFGLRLSRTSGMLLAILMIFNIGGLLALTVMEQIRPNLVLYVAVSFFLALSAVFFSAVIEADHRRLKIIFAAYVLGALVTALAGIIGYFNLFPGSEMFTRYGRAKGVFQDPNVFGPYLVLPACYLLHRTLTGGFLSSLPRIVMLLVFTLAIFLAFSRAAWGLYALSILLLVFFLLLKERSTVIRLRIFVAGIVGVSLLTVSLLVVLQFDQVSELFSQRARLLQEYDAAQFGRFDRYGLGFILSMDHPLGIGPLAFGRLFGEDTHNIWLKALLDYGWIGFVAFVILVVSTVAMGFKCLLRDRPWQPYFLCAYIVFVGHVLIATFIDIDHWRHFFILLGIIWGCIGLEASTMRNRRAPHARIVKPA